jgi:hypothetical protein
VCTLLIRPDSGTRSSGQSLEWLGGRISRDDFRA